MKDDTEPCSLSPEAVDYLIAAVTSKTVDEALAVVRAYLERLRTQ